MKAELAIEIFNKELACRKKISECAPYYCENCGTDMRGEQNG